VVEVLKRRKGGTYVKKETTALTAAALSLAIILSGCGSSTGNNTAGTTSNGKTLVYARGGDSVSLDPANATDGESFSVTRQIYETLIDDKPGTFDLTPRLATDWSHNADSTVWTFNLHQGITFQDGTPFNADAVVFNFNRWMDKSNPYHKGDFEYYPSMFGGFKGDPGAVIKDVKKVNDYSVEFDLAHPLSPFLADLTMPCFAIASPKDIQDHNGDINQTPVGTGPFKFVNWKPNDSITVTKNAGYWQQGLPKLDKVIFQVIKDNSARLNALKSGSVDLMDGLSPSDVASVKADSTMQVFTRPSNNVGYLAFNTLKKPFNDPRVRQAINMVVDKQALIDAYYSGQATPAATALPPVMWGDDKSIQSYPVDIAKAKELLKEAGFPNGFKTDLWAMPVARPYMPQPEKIATALQADMKQIGIDVKIVTYDWATYLKKTSNGEHTMALLGWTGDNGDPDDFLYVLLDSDNAKAPAQNIAFYSNPQVHKLLIQAQQEPDQSKRATLYGQAEQLINQDAPWVPLVHSTPALGGSSKVTGFVPNPAGSEEFINVNIQ
jgi:peptide/nickel transport system substrate-binding protein